MNITVCIIHNGSAPQLRRTLDSLEAQTRTSFDTQVLEAADFRSPCRNRLVTGGEYVLYLYSGSTLAENALEVLSKAALSGKAWYYFDEQVLGDDTLKKPAFSPIAFASSPFTGEGVLFSRQALDAMALTYEGDHFGAAILEMTIAAAMGSDGVHIPHLLLTRHSRKAPSPLEQDLLADALTGFLEARGMDCKAVGKGKTPGLYLYPEEVCEKTISFLLLPGVDDPAFRFCERHQVIRLTEEATYWETCLQGIRKASGDLVCIVGPGCTLPSRRDLNKLAYYASRPYAGLVSPCLIHEHTIAYTGTFTTAGIPFRFSRKDDDFSRLWKECYTLRETVFPAWQFWMADRALLLSMAESLPALSPEYAVMELAFRAEKMGRSSLYVGEVVAPCGSSAVHAPAGFSHMLACHKERFFLDPCCPTSLRAYLPGGTLDGVSAKFPEEMDAPKEKTILILTHELSLTGAPVVLSQAVPILKEAGWQVTVVSPVDGVLKDTFLRENVPVLVLGDMDKHDDWLLWAMDFDLILVNTVVPFRQIEQLRDAPIPVLWWLHDAKSGYEDYLRHVLPETVGDNIHIFSVSQYADDAMHTYRPLYPSGLLLYGLRDEADALVPASPMDTQGRKLFVSVGTVIHRKGQDILAQAIRLLPERIRNQCLFLFVGKNLDPDIFRHIEEVQKDYPEAVRHIPAIPREEIFSLYRQADAVICSSRDDPMPTFMAETMMVSGVCICSENTGTAGVIEHGVNGFLYPDDDPAKLAACIQAVAESGDLTQVRDNGRRLFEEVFTMDIFKQNLLRCVAQCIGETEDA